MSEASRSGQRSYGQGHLVRPGYAGVDVTSGLWRRQLFRQLLDLVKARVSPSPRLTWDWSDKPRSILAHCSRLLFHAGPQLHAGSQGVLTLVLDA